MSVGFIIGKFMPVHRGHMQLIRFARRWVDQLYVVVESVRGEPIPSTLRHAWVSSLFPDCTVLHLERHQPQDPSETPDFWSIWKQTLEEFLPVPIDVVFASEKYGLPLSEILDARFVPVDIGRDSVPISATEIRENPIMHWGYIPHCVQGYYRKKISIFGPESTGKTTLSQELTQYFGGTFVPEYARCYLESKDGEIEAADMNVIAQGQSILERITEEDARPFLFCDTDPRVCNIWNRFLFDDASPEIDDIARGHHYDLTLLLDVDVPFVDDVVRYIPDQRQAFFQACMDMLDATQAPYVVLRGSWNSRRTQAIHAISSL